MILPFPNAWQMQELSIWEAILRSQVFILISNFGQTANSCAPESQSFSFLTSMMGHLVGSVPLVFPHWHEMQALRDLVSFQCLRRKLVDLQGFLSSLQLLLFLCLCLSSHIHVDLSAWSASFTLEETLAT